jgi:hypothetical protein
MTWTNKTKTDESGDWTDKTKVPSSIPEGRLLTHDECPILVGENEDEYQIWREYSDLWNIKSKTDESDSWTNKTKVSS